MTDIAKLGIEIDTSGLAATEAALNRIAEAAARAKKAIEDLGSIRGVRLSFESVGDLMVGSIDLGEIATVSDITALRADIVALLKKDSV